MILRLEPRLLLIVDPQLAFLSERTAHAYDAALDATRRYTRTLVSQCLNPSGSSFRTLLGWDGCGADDRESTLDERFSVFATVTKSGYAVPAHAVQPYLEGLAGVDVAGVETDACVLATALALFDAGVDVRVRIDLCAGKLHTEAERILRRQIGDHRIVVADARGLIAPRATAGSGIYGAVDRFNRQ
jgi:hypothetical protein